MAGSPLPPIILYAPATVALVKLQVHNVTFLPQGLCTCGGFPLLHTRLGTPKTTSLPTPTVRGGPRDHLSV